MIYIVKDFIYITLITIIFLSNSNAASLLGYNALCRTIASSNKDGYQSILYTASVKPKVLTTGGLCVPIMLAMERLKSADVAQSLIEILLSKGMSINLLDGQGRTLLHAVVLHDKKERDYVEIMIRYLLAKGIDRTIVDRYGDSAECLLQKHSGIKFYYAIKDSFASSQGVSLDLKEVSFETRLMIISELYRIFYSPVTKGSQASCLFKLDGH